MLLRKLTGLFACALILGTAAFASAGVPDLQTTTAGLVYTGTETLSLFNLPNGAGKAFTEAFAPGGVETDGTIELTLRDGFSVPIANFPFEDMWIASADGGLLACGGTATADFNTNAAGETSWGAALFAGGNSQALCIVYINGDNLTSNGGLALSFNSADINGDGAVNLTDAGFFTGYLGGTNYAGDFNNDGTVNVSDAGFMATSLGASCP
jgi:hypothetical protein